MSPMRSLFFLLFLFFGTSKEKHIWVLMFVLFCFCFILLKKIEHFFVLLQGNPIHGLGQSISFGRFMSESLAWEKWSTFSHNRYVEEAERYSRPGSVAQKKAFFEAHYKNLAARKAAVLLEQANAAASASSDQNSTAQDSDKPVSNSEVPVDEHELSVESRAVDHANDAKMDDSEQPVSVENVKKVEFLRDLNEKTAKMEKSVSKVIVLIYQNCS